MSKRLYLNLFLSLLILLFGYNFASGLTGYWTIRIVNILSIVLAGFFLIKFNPSLLPKKNNSTFRIQYLFPIVIGIIGLFLINYFIPLLTYKLMDWEWPSKIHLTKYELIRYLGLITILGVLEELYFRRIIAQKIFNSKGFSKALWISALIFGFAHIVTDSGILGTFFGGLVLGYIYLKTKNIWISIFAHLTNNLISLFVSPFLDKNIADFSSYQKITIFIGFGLSLIYAMYLIFKKQTELKPAGNTV
ncbi:CPBP family intramembrane glutamic endopeptidase [Mariniflexile sp. AS56]|uniref:CPBP family intramembrane glutamic endopeptidase n=1 Tax=Mariniflexile sp. AS56 TaxID=3063957 RepID=UPI0026F35B97|nr:CPBP family intramembrane glutamic endopeptidase [Mariniflexile sp. AS56]MDO7171817.1 CPBP family intramembrane metalloprotease [Mariniflexile sp. AS56]